MRKLVAVLAAGLLGFGVAAQASAAAIALDPIPGASELNPLADSTTGVVAENVTITIPNQQLSPWTGTALDGIGTFTSVSADSTATYLFNELMASIALLWGSVDVYNQLHFYLDNVLIETVFGADLHALGAPVSTSAVLATISPIAAFNKIVFESIGNNAFEFANLSAEVVPVPGAIILLLTGLAGLGFASRKRRSA